MLVLSRKLNQSIRIGDNISLNIVRIKGNVVQLGIEAPSSIPILRSELIERDQRRASSPTQPTQPHHEFETQNGSSEEQPSEPEPACPGTGNRSDASFPRIAI